MEIKEKQTKDKADIAKHFLHILRAFYCMLRHSIFMDHLNLRLLLQRGKIAGHRLFSFHHRLDSLSCGSVDPTRAYYSPREVEFSCSNTPSYTFLHQHVSNKRRSRKRFPDAEVVAKAFEILNSDTEMTVEANFAVATPSPVAVWSYVRSPAVVRQLRVTDSPFPIREEEEEEGGRQVDREAEEFIKRFYEQLRFQQIG